MNSSAGRRPARFLLAIIDAGGTVPPALSLAAELVHRGPPGTGAGRSDDRDICP